MTDKKQGNSSKIISGLFLIILVLLFLLYLCHNSKNKNTSISNTLNVYFGGSGDVSEKEPKELYEQNICPPPEREVVFQGCDFSKETSDSSSHRKSNQKENDDSGDLEDWSDDDGEEIEKSDEPNNGSNQNNENGHSNDYSYSDNGISQKGYIKANVAFN
ncbi:MAG: hypothetical protein GY828_06875 [Candidatus Gracilibacteria bacterium]|nr:hypothetical protein [Candidatus Gracilibacteria bacterium]